MSNPAEELHALYASWRARIESKPSTSMATHLKPKEAVGITEILHAYALLSTIDRILRRLEAEGSRVAVFRKQLHGWARVPLSLDAGWGAAVHPDHLIHENTLDQIGALSSYLDGKVLTFNDELAPSLRTLVDRADSLLTDESGLGRPLHAYIRRLIAEIRYALDDEAAGRAFDFTDAAERLWVAFNAAAERAPDAKKSAWRELVQQVMVGFVSGGAVEAAKIGLQLTTGIS